MVVAAADLTHPMLSAVCLAVWRNHHMRTVTNYFIVNLSLADVLVTAICLPASLLVDITESWLFGHALCKVIPYLQVSSPTPASSLYHACLTPTALAGPSDSKVHLSGKSQWLRTFAGSPRPPGWTLRNTDTASQPHKDIPSWSQLQTWPCVHTQLPPGTRAHIERRQEPTVTVPNAHWICSLTPVETK